MAVKLNSVVPWGRSFEEYVGMFALIEEDLGKKILDCAAGPSSFGAEVNARGGWVIACDPIYAFSAEEIRKRVAEVRDDMMRQVREQMGQFVWEWIRSPQHLEEMRMGAMERFLADFSSDGKRRRYRVMGLPKLGFADATFELALCSHFLFLYSDKLDEAFHLESVGELLRVAGEVRIFPVTGLDGNFSPLLASVRDAFDGELVKVAYEFLKGADQMLVLRR
jgi:hypothetical protein